jgi:hypothetical protein
VGGSGPGSFPMANFSINGIHPGLLLSERQWGLVK